jgi:hypothetical protein
MKHGFVAPVLIGEVDSLVLAHRERDVPQHLISGRTAALDVEREAVSVTLEVQNLAKAHWGIDLGWPDRHARVRRGVGLARLIFRIAANQRKIVRRERDASHCEHRNG